MKIRPPRAGGGDELDALVRRAHDAIKEARHTVGRSEVLAAALDIKRDDEELLVRCAWCDRYSLAGKWFPADELPNIGGVRQKLGAQRVTHSICPDCMSAS